ncbi:toxin-antitoxin system YwqK family antitoxin [Chryseobacterium sp. T1]
MYKQIFTILISAFSSLNLYSQNIDLDKYEIYVKYTLISKSDFIKNGQNLTEEKSKTLEFKPISDGNKITYYLSGKIYSKGKIENGKENGFWEYWNENGKKAREGEFVDGKPNGTHKYWYENGNLRGIGEWKNGVYDGKWEMYKENGSEKIIQNYKEGKLIE